MKNYLHESEMQYSLNQKKLLLVQKVKYKEFRRTFNEEKFLLKIQKRLDLKFYQQQKQNKQAVRKIE